MAPHSSPIAPAAPLRTRKRSPKSHQPRRRPLLASRNLARPRTEASYADAEKANPPLLTLADLQGTWSDLDFASPLRGYWVFGPTTLRMDRKGMEARNRVQATLRFKLKGNLLTLTHEPDAFSNKRWDEKLVIERYEPGRLIDLGSLVLYRVK